MRPNRYRETLEKIVALLGVGGTIQTSIEAISTTVGEAYSATNVVMKTMVAVGAATWETKQIERGNKIRGSFFTIHTNVAEVLQLMKKQGVNFNDFNPYFQKKAGTWAPQQGRHPAKMAAVTAKTAAAPTATSESPFAPLRVLKRDESRAQLELARRYRDQELFIEQQVAKFKEMGLDFTPTAIKREQREDLEAITTVLPYVEGVIAENERLADQIKSVYKPSQELRQANEQIRAQKAQIERLLAEKQTIADSALELREAAARMERTKNTEIGRLEQIITDLRRQNGSQKIAAAVRAVDAEPRT